ncbi:MAG: tetratricopeptide repeat protein [Bacteroidetes bacterium]|nr:tetratricopeptide repeat protein [Bacteroidota bacterium]
MLRVFYILILSSFFFHFSSAQNQNIDSLLNLVKKDNATPSSLVSRPSSLSSDTNKVNHLNALAWEYKYTNPDSTILLAKEALALCEKLSSVSELRTPVSKLKANAYGTCGVGYWVKGDYPNALENFFKALKFDEEQKNKKGIATRLGNIGGVYWNQADYPKALDYYFRALKTFEELGEKDKIATVLGNIGVVYFRQAEANVHPEERNPLFKRVLEYYFRALKMNEELGNKNRIATDLGNIGNVYHAQTDYPRALNYYFRALKMAEELGDKNRIVIWLGNIGSLDITTGKFAEAEKYLKQSVLLAEEIGSLDDLKVGNQSLSQLYDTTGRYQSALEHYKKYIAVRDSITNDENTKKQTRTEMNYEFEKKEAKAKAEVEVKEAVAEAESKKQKIVIWSVMAVLLLVVIFAVFIFRALRITQKQKQLIEQQKKIVEEKQSEILASIRYAKRIQDAILPKEKYINKTLYRLKAKMPK